MVGWGFQATLFTTPPTGTVLMQRAVATSQSRSEPSSEPGRHSGRGPRHLPCLPPSPVPRAVPPPPQAHLKPATGPPGRRSGSGQGRCGPYRPAEKTSEVVGTQRGGLPTPSCLHTRAWHVGKGCRSRGRGSLGIRSSGSTFTWGERTHGHPAPSPAPSPAQALPAPPTRILRWRGHR